VMPYDTMKIQGRGGLNVVKWPISQCISCAGVREIKSLIVNYDTPRQYLL